MPTLLEAQTQMAAAVRGQPVGLGGLLAGNTLNQDERLSVYHSTYVAVLGNALCLNFPAVRRVVGAEFFEGAGRVYIEETPPTAANLNQYGERFADFLAAFSPAASLPYLADLARLEWAVSRALHADDASPLDLHMLALIAPNVQPSIRFSPNPSLAFVESAWPVDTIWRAVLADDDSALSSLDLNEGPVHLCIERTDQGVDVERLSQSETRFARALANGVCLGDAMATLSPDEMPALLAAQFSRQRLVAFHVNHPPEGEHL